MKILSLFLVLCLYTNCYCMEDLFGIQISSINNGTTLHYQMGNIFVVQTSEANGDLKYSGEIAQSDKSPLILDSNVAQQTFNQIKGLLKVEQALIAKKAVRIKKVS